LLRAAIAEKCTLTKKIILAQKIATVPAGRLPCAPRERHQHSIARAHRAGYRRTRNAAS